MQKVHEFEKKFTGFWKKFTYFKNNLGFWKLFEVSKIISDFKKNIDDFKEISRLKIFRGFRQILVNSIKVWNFKIAYKL